MTKRTMPWRNKRNFTFPVYFSHYMFLFGGIVTTQLERQRSSKEETANTGEDVESMLFTDEDVENVDPLFTSEDVENVDPLFTDEDVENVEPLFTDEDVENIP
ncbi:hypothetical protein STEG23_007798 [Scotinomys teguina]